MTDRTSPPVANTPMLLSDILAELRGLRTDLERAPVGVRQRVDRLETDVAAIRDHLIPPPAPEPVDGEPVELREPEMVTAAKPTRKRGGR